MKNVFGFLFAITLTTASWAEEIVPVTPSYGHESIGFHGVCKDYVSSYKTLEQSTQTFMKRSKADGNKYIIRQGADEVGFDSIQDEYDVFVLVDYLPTTSCWFEIATVDYKGGSMYYARK